MFRFSKEIGLPHPDFLPLDSRQISELRAFSEVYPSGEIRDDFRAAMIACVTTRAVTGKADFSDFVLPENLGENTRDARFLKRMRTAVAKARGK